MTYAKVNIDNKRKEFLLWWWTTKTPKERELGPFYTKYINGNFFILHKNPRAPRPAVICVRHDEFYFLHSADNGLIIYNALGLKNPTDNKNVWWLDFGIGLDAAKYDITKLVVLDRFTHPNVDRVLPTVSIDGLRLVGDLIPGDVPLPIGAFKNFDDHLLVPKDKSEVWVLRNTTAANVEEARALVTEGHSDRDWLCDHMLLKRMDSSELPDMKIDQHTKHLAMYRPDTIGFDLPPDALQDSYGPDVDAFKFSVTDVSKEDGFDEEELRRITKYNEALKRHQDARRKIVFSKYKNPGLENMHLRSSPGGYSSWSNGKDWHLIKGKFTHISPRRPHTKTPIELDAWYRILNMDGTPFTVSY